MDNGDADTDQFPSVPEARRKRWSAVLTGVAVVVAIALAGWCLIWLQKQEQATATEAPYPPGPILTAHQGWRGTPPMGIVASGLQGFDLVPSTVATIERKEYVAKHYWYSRYFELQIQQDKLVGQDGRHFAPGYMSIIRRTVYNGLRLHLTMVVEPQTEDAIGYGAAEPTPTYATYVFWREMMKYYAGNPHVVFDLFNEPRPTCGKIRRPTPCTWAKWEATMQPLAHYVRRHSSNQMWVQGLWWGSTFAGMPRTVDLPGVVYDYHHPGAPWQYQIPASVATWDRAFGYLADAGYKVMNGEFGNYRGSFDFTHARRSVDLYLRYLTAHHIGLMAWTLMPGALNSSYDLRSAAHQPESDGWQIQQYFKKESK